MLSFLNPYSLYIKLGLGVALALFVGWSLRVSYLRGQHEATLHEVAAALKVSGAKHVHFDDLKDDVDRLAQERDTAAQNFANASAAVDTQNTKIADLGAAAKVAEAKGDAARQQAATAIADRNIWIGAAQRSATRTVAGTDTQERSACDSALLDVYRKGF